MSEIKKILEIANEEVGYLEKASREQLGEKIANAGDKNYTKYAEEMDALNVYNGKKNGYPWCNVFVDWCFYKAVGIDRARELLIGFSAGCTQDYNWFKSKNRIVTEPQVGDLVFFGKTSHIGIIEKVENGKIYTIEGNTSNEAELIVNGGQVAKKSYDINSKNIHSFARPKYNATVEENTTVQKEEVKKDQIKVDGKWGKETTTKAQKVFRTTVDGIVSNQYLAYKDKNKGLLASTFEWEEKPSKNGSELIKAIQKFLKIKVDGFIGPDTIKGMQRWLGTTVDGYVSETSEMVKAFQIWLNKQ